MIKHRWRELAKSFGNHVDPQKTEQLKRTKSEIENNVTRIFKLIKNEELGKKDENKKDSKEESELVGLIENFYQQYQSLYDLYDHLVGDSGRIVRGRKERKGFPMSPSSSDSEYYSSEEVDGHHAKLGHDKSADSIRSEHENLEVGDMKQKSVTTSEEKEAINSEYLASLRKSKQAEVVDKDLKDEVDERVRELSALVEAHESHGNQSPARVKELEGQLAGFKVELDSLCSQKRDLEAWKEGKAAESKQLGEKNTALRAQVLELEFGLKEKEDEVSHLQMELKKNEDTSASKISELVAQTSSMQQEIDSLHGQKGEVEKQMVSKKNESLAQIKGLKEQANVMQKELKALKQQKTESEAQLDRKNKEISKHLIQIETMKEELTRKDTVENRTTEERQFLIEKLKHLEQQVDSRRSYKKILEKQIKNRNQETNKLRQENEGLLSRIFGLERTSTEGGEAVYALRKEYEDGGNGATSLTAEVSGLKQNFDSLLGKKSQLEIQNNHYLERLNAMENQNNNLTRWIAQIERENNKHTEALTEKENQINNLIERENKKHKEVLTEKENQINNLMVKISDQQISLKEQEDAIKKLNRDHRQAKIWFPSSKLNIQVAERKMEELAEKYRINLEDSLRLLYQRIRVAEQIHIENKEAYNKLKERYENETRGLKEKLAIYQDPAKRMKEISETGKTTLKGLDSVVLKFEEGHQKFVEQISRMSNEVESVKCWVAGMGSEMKRLKNNVDSLVAQLNEKEEEEGVLREKVGKLEESASLEARKRLKLKECLSQVEEQVGNVEREMKEKDEDLLSLSEEKREAIRQLCVSIDHHRSRYDDLKEAVSKRSTAARGRTTTQALSQGSNGRCCESFV